VADAVRLVAAVELGKRLFDPGSGDRPVLHTPADVYAFVCEMSRLRQEHFRCLYLNNLNRVVGDRIISIGTINSSPVHPREVFFGAVEYSAQALILVHNHPSGNPEPSPQDLRLTNRLAAVARLFSIALLDHVIVGKHSYYSFKDHARLDSGGELSMPTES
jgi:DNA repair protein RadC